MLKKACFLTFVIFKGREKKVKAGPLVVAKAPGIAGAPAGYWELEKYSLNWPREEAEETS